ncbi:AraC family transcriptional regulator [Sulfitobacter sp. S190]|uniref:helix-turn-helix transcriptional regulator n=1 Tax=Sulfitobacter sp. S190 TaxID=2867022 RepID=UPI0021A6BB6C|nr:AraC family transcriptional regulator [Sulfitobacter sp. S190]UWR24540.1 AraC family transcriptional regulator [Sulfitobacter sp. S190]
MPTGTPHPRGIIEHFLGGSRSGLHVVESTIAGSHEVEFARVIQKNVTDQSHLDAERFVLGTTITPAIGKVHVDFGEKRRKLNATGNGFYLNPSENSWTHMDGEVDISFIDLPMRSLSDLLQIDEGSLIQGYRPLHDAVVMDDPLARPLALSIWQQARSGCRSADLYVDQALHTLALHLLSLARGDQRLRALDEGLAKPPAALSDPKLDRARDFIEANLALPIRVSDLARESGMSNSSFARAFKATTGEAAWAYVRRRRLETAMAELLNSQTPIAEIAFQTGFSSQAHLTSAFREYFGKPPGQVRSSG